MTPATDTNPLRLSQLTAGTDLHHALACLESEVRRQPGSAGHRWALVEMLCVLGQWERALKHLQLSVQLSGSDDVQWHSKAHMLRGLIRAEAHRVEVFGGRMMALPVVDTPPWMQDLGRALACNARGEHGEADRLRRSALDAAPTRPVVCSWCDSPQADALAQEGETLAEAPFEWIGDSDTRLGPVCEFIAASGYRWLAFADIAELRMEQPRSLLDLVWRPATLRLHASAAGAQTVRGFVPSRYCGTERLPSQTDPTRDDALLLARLTEWHEVGDTGVFAVGQKTWMTEAGDMPLLGLRLLRLVPASADAGALS